MSLPKPLRDYTLAEVMNTATAARYLTERDTRPCSQQAVIAWCQQNRFPCEKDEAGLFGPPGQWWIDRAALEAFERPKRGPRFKVDR